METILKKPYEISLWDEQLIWHRRKLELADPQPTKDNYEVGKFYSQNQKVSGESAVPYTLDYTAFDNKRMYYTLKPYIKGNFKEGAQSADIDLTLNEDDEWSLSTILQYYKERKICTIGSNTMETPIRAVQPKFSSNVNGSHTLTFVMYSHYWDEDNNILQWNPFMRYLTNERKVKLKYNGKWYDFIVKNISEDSASKAFTYTCKDLFINELSKSGFELEFDNELENNMGTINELAERILEGSDWQYQNENKLIVRQYLEEPLYEAKVKTAFSAKKMYDGDIKSINIPIDSIVYIFYSSMKQNDSSEFSGDTIQFLYDKTQKYQLDDANIIIGHTEDSLNEVYNFTGKVSIDKFEYVDFIPTKRGKKIIKSQQTAYDAKIDRLVGVYNDGAVYGFKDTEYVSPAAVRSYVTSGDCSSISGWRIAKSDDTQELPDRQVIAYPQISTDNINDWQGSNYIQFNPQTNKSQYLINTGISDNKLYIGSFKAGDIYWLRGNFFKSINGESKEDFVITEDQIKICSYEFTDKNALKEIKSIFTITRVSHSAIGEGFNNLYECECNKSISESDLKAGKYGIIIQVGEDLYVKDLEFFKREEFTKASGGTVYLTPNMETFESYVKEQYKYYNPASIYTSLEDLTFLKVSDSPSSNYTPVYGEGAEAYEKVRSITAKESNRFNLLQSLCELFECWCRFTINHDTNGAISLDKNLRQEKFVSFHEYIGKNNYTGFRYGTNLKSIKRTLDSDGAISKIIVKQNANEFGKNGFCTIARAEENPSGENFIYNFDYYVGQGLINFSTLNNDIYGSPVGGYLGYYQTLKKLNTQFQELEEKYSHKGNDIANHESLYQTHKNLYDVAVQEEIDKESELRTLTGLETVKEVLENADWSVNKEVIKILQAIARCKAVKKESGTIYERQAKLLTQAKKEEKVLEEQLNEIRKQKLAVNKTFYKKYSRFIQEGSWISEDYIDDNLYYIDALSTLYTSSRPQVNYTIEVVELSQLEGYEHFNFEVGDKTFVEDKEFFGWAYDGSKRLYREEVIVSETVIELDSPEKNSIKVQNYKTQFEDLFQRVVATTQQVQFSTGEYQRSAAIVQPDGTLLASTLQNSIINNAITLQNSRDQSVRIDENGITTTNLSRPSEMLRLVAGGIFLSKDGGTNWTTGISANGINANAITTGQLNAAEVNITMGSEIAFRWDLLGITAYKRDQYGIDSGVFTRFDQFGIYGVNGIPNFNALDDDRDRAAALEYIKKKASYGLTWDGFWLKSNGDNGYISISSDQDFQVIKTLKNDAGEVTEETAIIQIGRLSNNNYDYYGIRINNQDGNTVMETNQDGQLWLKEQLHVATSPIKNTEVIIGLSGNDENSAHGEKIIDANDKFKVYEDGYLVGNGVKFTNGYFEGNGVFEGTITATGGQIGGLTIEQWKEMSYSVRITSTAGTILKNGGTTLTATLYKGNDPVEIDDEGYISETNDEGESISYTLSYQWYNGNTELTDEKNNTLDVSLNALSNNDSAIFTCIISLEQVMRQEEENG